VDGIHGRRMELTADGWNLRQTDGIHGRRMEFTCAICLEPIQGNVDRCPGICSGAFHTKCLETWVVLKPTCPTCRTSFEPVARSSSLEPSMVHLPAPSRTHPEVAPLYIEGQDAMMRLGPPPLTCRACGCTHIVNANGCDQVCTRCGLVVRSVYYNR